MRRTHIGTIVIVVICSALLVLALWYAKTQVKLISKEERRAIVVREVDTALERYYDEHGRYPVVQTNEDLLRELSAKKYFDNDVRLDVVRYVEVNNGQTYRLE